MESSQFQVLYRVFLLRVVDLELLSADGDPMKLVGQLAALLAAVSFLFCTPLILASGAIEESSLWTLEHALIATTMLLIGLFSVLNWDSIFPDKRDVLVLAPLPVHPEIIFVAKLSALAYAMGVSALALNVFSGLLWPLYLASTVSFMGILRSFAAYWTTVAVAAAFMFFTVLSIQGVASQLMPRQLFLRLSALIQTTLFCIFLGMYILEPSLETPQALNAPENQRLLAWLPTYWFFGLFHRLDGVKGPARAAFAALADRASIALVVVIATAAATLLLTYFRSLRRIAEEPDILPHSHQLQWLKRQRFPGNPLSATIMFFCLRTLLRSRHHRVILSFYFGVGFAIVLAYIRTLFFLDRMGQSSSGTASPLVSSPVLAASILMMCVGVAGIRVVSSLPIALHANWIFRITELREPSAYLATTRRAFAILGIAPVWLGSCVLFFAIWPWSMACEHLLVLALLGMILVELSLHGFRKIPFTCSYLPGKGNLQYVFWACALFLLPLINAAAQAEIRMLNHPLGYCTIIAALCVALAGARWNAAKPAPSLPQMQFDEVSPPELCSLNLNRN
jgi:hypothetical protein